MSYPDFGLTGQVALMTGATQGIGYGVAKALAHAGAKVSVTARRTAGLELLVTEIRAEGGEAQAFALDVRNVGQTSSVMEAVQRTFGRLDILVNNAGLGTNQAALDVTEAEWDELIDLISMCSFSAVKQLAA